MHPHENLVSNCNPNFLRSKPGERFFACKARDPLAAGDALQEKYDEKEWLSDWTALWTRDDIILNLASGRMSFKPCLRVESFHTET